MIILGLNAAYHEPAAAILVDGRLVHFVEEERLNRQKHGKVSLVDNPHLIPVKSIQACLAAANCTLDDVTLIGFSFAETGRLKNIGVDTHLEPNGWGTREGEEAYHSALQRVPEELQKLGKRPVAERFRWVPHHIGHAGSAFLCSPFDRALILAIDGIAEFDSLLLAEGTGDSMQPLLGLPYPHSLGFLWEKICKYLGFSEYDACKVMGLATYGNPKRFRAEFSRLARLNDDGMFQVDPDVARFRSPDFSTIEALFGPRRLASEKIEDHHRDAAAVLQAFTEEAMLSLCQYGKTRLGAEYLCLSGGVALNCLANARIQKESGFRGVYVQPAANDAGSALGCALHLWTTEGKGKRCFTLDHAYWGNGYTKEHMEGAIKAKNLPFQALNNPAERAADLLTKGKVIGWFQGRMEMGPRALGNRSLLADPRRHDMRDILNLKIKHREAFRPFAPSVLAEKAREWFDMPGECLSTDFMLFAYAALPKQRPKIPAVTHFDGTSRIQTVRKSVNPNYHALISAFHEKTGVPMVLNTSFNDSEPIVMSPEDALNTFLKTGIDAVFLDHFLVTKG